MKRYEMKLLLAVALAAIAVVAFIGLSGCNGPAPNGAPLIEFANNSFDYNSVKIGSVVPLEINVTPGTGDPSTTFTANWTADPEVGTFEPATQANTSWIAPNTPGAVLLSVHVKTAYGFTNNQSKLVVVRDPANP
jgi:hypothetical protein